MSDLNQTTLKQLSHLARLDLTEEEERRFSAQLSSVMDYVNQLSQLGLTADRQTPQEGTGRLHTALAADQPRQADDPLNGLAQALLAAVPTKTDNLIQVRSVLNEEGESI